MALRARFAARPRIRPGRFALLGALKASIDPEAFEKMRGTVSFPFQPGEHHRIAVKAIDFRGNEGVRVMPLE